MKPIQPLIYLVPLFFIVVIPSPVYRYIVRSKHETRRLLIVLVLVQVHPVIGLERSSQVRMDPQSCTMCVGFHSILRRLWGFRVSEVTNFYYKKLTDSSRHFQSRDHEAHHSGSSPHQRFNRSARRNLNQQEFRYLRLSTIILFKLVQILFTTLRTFQFIKGVRTGVRILKN